MTKKDILSSTFGWLFLGLFICFGVSYATTYSKEAMELVYGSFGGYGYVIFIALELIAVFVLSLFIRKIPPLVAKIIYILYTALTGLTFSGIFIIYTSSSIAYVFLATSILFGAFAIIGKTTDIDLSKWSVYLFVALIAIVILEIINIFIMNNTLNMILCIAGILIFCAYTAYDIQIATNNSYLEGVENKGIYCALQLFIDFINIFLDLLRLFGRTRD